MLRILRSCSRRCELAAAEKKRNTPWNPEQPSGSLLTSCHLTIIVIIIIITIIIVIKKHSSKNKNKHDQKTHSDSNNDDDSDDGMRDRALPAAAATCNHKPHVSRLGMAWPSDQASSKLTFSSTAPS